MGGNTTDLFFFFNDTATTEIYTLSLHDALPISPNEPERNDPWWRYDTSHVRDRKSTRLNSSHSQISYAVFCLKKKNKRHSTCSDPLVNLLQIITLVVLDSYHN